MQSYADPVTNTNYFSPVFRPSTDLDARYAQYVSANSSNKYNPGVALVTGQGLTSSQEVKLVFLGKTAK
jgi:hypothetical protein